MEIVLTGDPISAERAYELGLVNDVVDEGAALRAAIALAERICANAPIAVRESRAVVLAADVENDEALWKMSAKAMRTVMATEDFNEGPLAFIEKRPAQWTGR